MNILEARRRMLGAGVYKKTVTGNPAIAQGSLARMYPGIGMEGWTKQDSTPTPENPVPIVSAGKWNEETQKWEYGLNLTGKNLFDKSTAIKNKYISDITGEMSDRAAGDTTASDYVLVGGLSYIRVTDTTFTPWMAFYDGNKNFVSGVNGYKKPIPVPQNAEYARFTISNSVVDTFVVNPGETLLPYEPYKPPQTVTLTSDRPLTKWDKLTEKDGQWGWEYGSAEIVFDGSDDERWGFWNNGFYIVNGLENILKNTTILMQSLCDKFSYTNPTSTDVGFVITSTGGSYSPRFWINGISDIADWRNFLSENNVIYLYPTETPAFTPLSASEQEALNALHTNRPTTILSNDADCEMTLTYKTKKSLEVTA